MSEKSVVVTYLLWFFGGFFGIHHIYLKRDRQAVLWCTSLGFLSLGWILDLFLIPQYVKETNKDAKYIEMFKENIKKHEEPPFSFVRTTGGILAGLFWGGVIYNAVPMDTIITETDLTYLRWLTPLGIATGVWTVGNIGNQRGNFWAPLISSYITYTLIIIFDMYIDYYYSILLTSIISQLSFHYLSKRWCLQESKETSMFNRMLKLVLSFILFSLLVSSYTYFNLTMPDYDGKEVKVYYFLKKVFDFLPEAFSRALNN